VALTLRSICSLKTEETARTFVVTVAVTPNPVFEPTQSAGLT
jgi:predicted RNA polymerase sigma factor